MKHDKRFEKLEELDDYELVNEEQDIRGLPLVNEEGKQLGVIKDLLVSEDKDEIAAIRLDDGRVCAVAQLEIHDNSVVYGKNANAYANQGVTTGDVDEDEVVKEEVVPVIEEKVTVGKRVADHGRDITVQSRVKSDTVNKDVSLHEEDVSVEKRKVDEPIDRAEAEKLLNQGDKKVTMTEQNEEVVVAKDAVKTDEVVIKKTAQDNIEHVSETVRKTEVDVDDKKTQR